VLRGIDLDAFMATISLADWARNRFYENMQDLTWAFHRQLTTWIGRRVSLALDNIAITSTNFFYRNSTFV